MNKRILVILIAAVVVGMIGFAFTPAGGELLAATGAGGCKQVIENTDLAGAAELVCRRAIVFYAEGTCSGKCAMVPALPKDAKHALDQFFEANLQVVSFTYVRMIDENREPVDKLATVCYQPNAVDKVLNPTIWIFDPHSASWSIGAGYWTSWDQLCVNHVGEFSTVLVGRPK